MVRPWPFGSVLSSSLLRSFETVEELKGDEKWHALDVIVDHAVFPGWSKELRPMTSAEVASTRVLRLRMEDGQVSAKVRAEGVNDDPEDLKGLLKEMWAGIIPITRVYGPAVNDVSSSAAIPKSLQSYPELRSGRPPFKKEKTLVTQAAPLALGVALGLLLGALARK